MNTSFARRWALAAALAGVGLFSPACNLDREPFYAKSPAQVFTNFDNYPGLIAKVYAGLATSGQKGPNGNPDLTGLDEGFGQYTRALFNMQELTTDVAVVAWHDDAGLIDMHYMTWDAGNQFPRSMYNRIFYQIALCNEFLRQTTDAKLSAYGISGGNVETVKHYRAEVRVLRALSYWHAIDLFGNVPFSTEDDAVSGSFKPRQISRSELFGFIEKELLDLGADANNALPNARQAEYGRVDKGAAWMILAKLYLNAEIYTGQPKYTECLTYCKKLIGAGYSLSPNSPTKPDGYRKLFMADNNTSPETIMVVPFDGLMTQSYGGTTFLLNGSLGGSITRPQAVSAFGTTGVWVGLRATKQLIQKFPDTTQACPDKRFLFHTLRQTLDITAVTSFNQGFMFKKWRNLTSVGQPGSNVDGGFADIDLPLFRLADVYLMYAECVLRPGATGGNATDALNYVNLVRRRAYNGMSGDITSAQLTLPFLLDERARELYMECHRRTDLIRFGKYTSGYNWAWKGNVAAGQDVGSFRALYPIPNEDLSVNPNLKQNDGY